MTNMSKLALLAITALTVTTTIASAVVLPTPRPSRPHNHSNVIVECRVKGDDFYVINFGDKVLDTGIQIEWRSPSTDDSGKILLPKRLAPGDEVKLAEVLSDFAIPGSPCSAAVV